jgi:general L-amino acid transport system permease protein
MKTAPKGPGPAWNALVWQAVLFGLMATAAVYLFHNVNHNLQSRGVLTGFAFLDRVARIPIANSPVDFEPGVSTYAFALVVGALNTLKISVVAVVLATVLGTLIGIGRLSSNWLLSKLCFAYVEAFRNVPVLVHILMWYQVLANLPGPREAFNPLPGVFVSNRGVLVPGIQWQAGYGHVLAAFAVAVAGLWWAARRARLQREATGAVPRATIASALGFVLLPFAVWALLGAPVAMDWPELDGFDFSGGAVMTPEYSAMVVGLVVYTAAFVAEIVRSGIESVGKGQWEAAEALGVSRAVVLWKVVLPQALRVSIPPMTNEYLSILKNSSLAVAIGYQEIVSVGNTMLYETGQAIEVVLLTMGFYVLVSLAVSLLMNWYNARVALVER